MRAFFFAGIPEKTMKIATWNVNSLNVRLGHVLDYLREEQPDVLLLQELKMIEDRFPELEIGDAGYNSAVLGQKTYNGVAILSKQPITSPEFGLLPSRQRRAYLIVETKIRGLKFKIATCHLDSYLKEGAVRAVQLDVFFKKLKSHENALFLGDFNFGDNEQPETKHIDKNYTYLWSKVNAGKKGYTWNIEKSEMARKGSFPKEKSRRLDRILIKSKRVKPISANILGDKPLKGKANIFPSDHFGLHGKVAIE